MQGLFENLRSMKRWHVQSWHAADMAGSWVTLTREGRAAHVWRWCWALIVVLTLGALFVKGQSQPLTFLPAVTEPHTHHLKTKHKPRHKKNTQKKAITQTISNKHQVHVHLSPSQDHQICALFPEYWAWDT